MSYEIQSKSKRAIHWTRHLPGGYRFKSDAQARVEQFERKSQRLYRVVPQEPTR